MNDRIEIRGLRADGVHGVLPEEQRLPQPFEIDLDLDIDLRPAGASDALADTVDYGVVTVAACAVVTGERHALLERLAERIAEVTLEGDGRLRSVTVVVRKLAPPLSVPVHTVGVRISRP